jgi:malonyl-CoA/methylmalonyl-CoA synthetase
MASHLLDQFPATALDRAFITTAEGRVLTYGGLDALSARLAHALTALGVKPGDRVAAQVDDLSHFPSPGRGHRRDGL